MELKEKKKILFVDDDPGILQSMRRAVRQTCKGWECDFAPGGAEALKKMNEKEFDLIISDMRMPHMDGATLLKETKKRYPEMIRFILSGQTQDEAFLRAIGPMHQFLSKPCEFDFLKKTVDRAFSFRYDLSNPDLKNLILSIQSIPSLPEVYNELMEEVQSPDCSFDQLAAIISKDVGMVAKILQISNSAFFGYSQKILSVKQAIEILGLEMIQALVLSDKIFSKMEGKKSETAFIEKIWRHSLQTAQWALAIAKKEKLSGEHKNYAFTAGLLHEIGRVVLAFSHPEQINRMEAMMKEKNVSLLQAEREIFKTTHADVGAYIVNLWGLPDPVVEAIAYHHRPSQCPEISMAPLTLVHVANAFNHELQDNFETDPSENIDREYISTLGFCDRIDEWRNICRQKMEEASNE